MNIILLAIGTLFTAFAVAAANTPNVSHAPFYWLHVPKTGSSFATTIGTVCCGPSVLRHYNNQSTDWPWWFKKNLTEWPCMEACAGVNGSFAFGSHTPLGQEVQASLRVIEDENDFFSRYKVITFLRHPRSRIESGFFHNLHSCDALQKESFRVMKLLNVTGSLRHKVVAYVRTIISNDTLLAETLQKYVDCVKGCSVKMITGGWCGDSIIIPKESVDMALSRIEKFAFVGFQENWEDSVKRFVAMFGGSFTEESLINSRKGHTEFTVEEVRKVSALLELPQYQDEYDEALYNHALKCHRNKTHDGR